MVCLVHEYQVQQQPFKIADENCICENGCDNSTGYQCPKYEGREGSCVICPLLGEGVTVKQHGIGESVTEFGNLVGER